MRPCKYINKITKQSRKIKSNSEHYKHYKHYIHFEHSESSEQSEQLDKNFYLDIIEKIVEGYGYDYFQNMANGKEPFVICIGLRDAGAISYLLSNGRKLDWFDMWIKLMDKSCEELLRKHDFVENDLSVKEMIIALKNMKNFVDEKHYLKWYEMLKSIDPYKTYYCIYDAKKYTKMCNMTIYNMSGEYLRESEGMTDTTDYFDIHWPWMLNMFD